MPVEMWGAVYNTEMGIGFLRPLLFLASLARTSCSSLKHRELSLWLPGIVPLTGISFSWNPVGGKQLAPDCGLCRPS